MQMFYGTSDIIESIQAEPLANGTPAERLQLRGGPVLVLTEEAMALYRDADSPDDPLGNGLITLAELTGDHALVREDGHFVREHRAGYIGLMDDKAMLITPAAIQLFANRDDALRNQNELARLAFE
ncbi:hypothetical protein [Saccharospirillum salsuginis]|uniref:Uncharacterized protein n=1 Tax=Saccharospirillum salsuginis TaxID=418750 RepID=A0A918NHI7_9GAMM|nr:hypothetical protein [Saccharospirillum salsuginis]GGX73550.1 hypothetical protein GCM10007392_46260 [Saccharospirillum salsuginis]